MELIWIRQQNQLMQAQKQNIDYAIKLALTGVISSWTKRQWNDFNQSVKLL